MDIPGPSSESKEPLPPHHIKIDIPKSQRLYIVRDKMREEKPVAVSIGPYHYWRDDQLGMVEPFKLELRDMLCGSADRITSLKRTITERIHEFYTEPCGHEGEELAEIVFRDACFLICFMHGFGKDGVETYIGMCERMGMSDMLLVSSDICMLENQIPLWLIRN